MSINVEIGGATANSYVSVASADSYFGSRVNSESWNNISANTNGTATTTEKQNLLKEATREIDNNMNFHEHKYYDVSKGDTNYQSLEFPRSGSSSINASGDVILVDDIKYATYEQALWLKERGGKKTSSDGAVINPQTIGDKSVQYIKDWINVQIKSCGNSPWKGSNY